MELFIPSILALLVAAIVVMYLLPRLSPVVLGVLALIFLGLAAWNHYTFFGSEYQISTWQLPLVQFAPYILIGGLVLFMLFFIINFIGTGSSEAAAPVAAMNDSVNKVVNTAGNTAPNRPANAAPNRPPNAGANRGPNNRGNLRFSQA